MSFRSASLWTTLLILLPACTVSADEPLPTRISAARMTVPPGFHVTLFAGEPDVVQPIAFTFDDRGRLWVIECLSYPKWSTAKEGTDRIVIFEDTDGDGRFDKRTVFYDKGVNLSGIALGFGGVWLCSSPNLLFLPHDDATDKPSGPPRVVLDGWNLKEAGHNVFNSLTWGPDGWLYGCNGIQSKSRVGKPGTPDAQRTYLDCGVWRYHPTREMFEVVAHGTTNPWGLDFDEYGQAFITNCVIKHLWHVIPGAHFQRMYGQDANPNSFGLMESCADHIHWGGGKWTESRVTTPSHDAAGGGHAHVGAMVYLGDNWPAEYRNGLFTCNLHGNRVNHDLLERSGSGYVAHHGKDFLLANDPWFRGLALQYGPDGGVYITDWTDTGECHNHILVDQTNGRIYKVVHGQPKPWSGDLTRLSDDELVQLQLHPNEWQARHARRLLQEHAAKTKVGPKVVADLLTLLREQPSIPKRLRALWTLYAIGAADQTLLTDLLGDPSEYVRGWAIRLLVENRRSAEPVLAKFAALAARDPSPWVRVSLASALQRLPSASRWTIAEALLTHAEDASGPNLPLMNWYGMESLADVDATRFLALIAQAKLPIVREYGARRLSLQTQGLEAVVADLGKAPAATQRDLLEGIKEALADKARVAMPAGWPATYSALLRSPDARVRKDATFLAVLFNDREVVKQLRDRLADKSAAAADRLEALQSLSFRKDPALVPILQALLPEPPLRLAALQALAAYDDKQTPELILNQYAAATEVEKAAAISSLASRPSYAHALLDAVAKGRVPRKDVSVFNIRQMQAFKDKTLNQRVGAVWGTVRSTPDATRKLMATYQAQFAPAVLQKADRSHGRQLFQQTCANCHVLFGEGSKIGPELTGSQRTNVDYLLENILDPSAIVPSEYQVTVLVLKDGRVITGLLKSEAGDVFMMQTDKELLRILKSDVEERTKSKDSMMPEGLLTKLKTDEVRDLLGYLLGPGQVKLPGQQ
jgi:putative membrane-bound dehydrogenase-like protein